MWERWSCQLWVHYADPITRHTGLKWFLMIFAAIFLKSSLQIQIFRCFGDDEVKISYALFFFR